MPIRRYGAGARLLALHKTGVRPTSQAGTRIVRRQMRTRSARPVRRGAESGSKDWLINPRKAPKPVAPPPRREPLKWYHWGAAIGMGLGVFYGAMTLARSITTDWNLSRSAGGDEAEVDTNRPTEAVYDTIAAQFDSLIDDSEWWLRIGRLRQKVTAKCTGDVLEVAVGTGKNSVYYQLDKCRSITMLDASGPMLDIARQKWKDQTRFKRLREWREGPAKDDGGIRGRGRFLQLSAAGEIPPPPVFPGDGAKDAGGYTTILSTFSLCSIPRPAETLAHLCEQLAPPSADGEARRVLLIEHGKSHYGWMNNLLDNTAHAHAKDFGCWWNRDIGSIVEQAAGMAGMEVVEMRRKHFGTTWIVEMRPKDDVWRGKQKSATALEPANVVKAKPWWRLW